MASNPVSPVATALVLALPGIWFAGRTFARATLDDLWLTRLTAPGFALAAWLLVVHVTGLLTKSFLVALWLATLLVSLAGLVAHFGRIDRPPPARWVPGRSFWIGAGASTAVMAAAAFRYAIHDQLFFTGHMSITAALQNGPYPPANLNFPTLELRYHYGFDIVTAAITSVFRIPIDVGIDLVTLLCWFWLVTLLWAAGDFLLGRGRGWIGATVVTLAGGFPFTCIAASRTPAEVLLGACSTGGILVNPPLPSYFFQHPWAIGLPLAVTLLFAFLSSGRRAVRYASVALLLVAISISQIVLFATLAAVLVVAELGDKGGLSWRRGGSMLLVSVSAVLFASTLGGFFVDWSVGQRSTLALNVGVADGLKSTIAWHIASFGALLPLGFWGLAIAPQSRIRTLLFTSAVGGLLILNFVEYTYSWDIAKFGTIALISLGAGTASLIAHFLDNDRRLAAGTSVAIATIGAIGFLAALALPVPGVPGYLAGRPIALDRDDLSVVDWLRHNAGQTDVVYRRSPYDAGYAQWGGLPQANLDPMARRLGLPTGMLREREQFILGTLPDDAGEFLAQGIRWVVVDSTDVELSRRVDNWLQSGSATVRARFGQLRVIQLLADSTVAVSAAIHPAPRFTFLPSSGMEKTVARRNVNFDR